MLPDIMRLRAGIHMCGWISCRRDSPGSCPNGVEPRLLERVIGDVSSSTESIILVSTELRRLRKPLSAECSCGQITNI
jgi:hypothetical protein